MGSHEGGAIEARIREAVEDHLFLEHGVKTGIYGRQAKNWVEFVAGQSSED